MICLETKVGIMIKEIKLQKHPVYSLIVMIQTQPADAICKQQQRRRNKGVCWYDGDPVTRKPGASGRSVYLQ